MAMGTKLLVLMFAVDIFMYFGSSAVCSGCSISSLSVTQSFGLEIDNDVVVVNETNPAAELSQEITASTGVFSGSILTTIFSTFVLVVDFVIKLFAFAFAPVYIALQTGLPSPIALGFFGIWAYLYIIALLDFVRGGEF